jgi:hypothetical protein
MPKFTFKGVDASGQEIEGSVEDDTQEEAIASIRASGYFPTSVELAESEPAPQHDTEEDKTPLWYGTSEKNSPQPKVVSHGKPATSESPNAGLSLQGSESLPPYGTPFIAGLHIFAGCCAVLAFLIYVMAWVSVSSGTSDWAAERRSQALTACLWTAVLALINFGLAQIIDIIARASYAARQQVILLRQLVQDNGSKPNV